VDGREVDVRIAGGRILAVGTVGSLRGGAEAAVAPGEPRAADGAGECGAAFERVDLRGYLLLPAPVEAHSHLDTAFGSGHDGPGADPAARSREIQRRLVEGALSSLGYGAAEQRTHIRIGGVGGLGALEAALAAREALRGLVELQAVACPRLLTGRAGADGRAQLREVVKAGAHAVGGCPELDPDPAGFVEELAVVAGEFGCAVDLHSDGADPVRLARTAVALGPLRPRVAIGPLGRLGRGGPGGGGRGGGAGATGVPLAAGQLAAGQLAAHGVAVVWLPQSGTCAGDRGTGGAGGQAGYETAAAVPLVHPAYGVRVLADAGVSVAAGGGGPRGSCGPVGSADPLRSAFALAASGALAPEAAYAAVSSVARRVLGLDEVRVDAGFPAELLAVRGESVAEVLSGGHSRVVVHRGRVVSRTSAVREFADPPAGGRGPGGAAGGQAGGGSAVPRQGGAR
jgi:cytosine deaminase